MLHASAVDDEETMGGGCAKWVVVVAGAGPTREVLRFELTMPTDGASAPTIAPLSRTSLDGSAVGMAWSDGAAQGVVGTDAGNIWHVHWASPQPATPLVSAVPPPMTQLAMPRHLPSSGGGGGGRHAPSPAVMASVSRGTVMDGAACGVLLWDARRAGCAQPLARVHFASDVATCVALSPTAGGREGEGETALAIGYASGAVRLLYVDQLAMEPTPLCQHGEAVVALAFAPHGRVLSATAAGDVRLSSVAEGSQTVRGAPPPPPPPPSTRASIVVAAARTNIDALDVLPMTLPGLDASACWLCATAAQEVQVWPLSAIVPEDEDAAPPPLAQLQLERFDALISLPTEMQPLGWRCLAVFCPYHPQLIAACGVTQRKQVPSRALIAPAPRALNLALGLYGSTTKPSSRCSPSHGTTLRACSPRVHSHLATGPLLRLPRARDGAHRHPLRVAHRARRMRRRAHRRGGRRERRRAAGGAPVRRVGQRALRAG